jgi:2-polyprenyl-3-methyl-5-hydroxy-6-metoxy-1,4-benzoquinol methylase
MNIQYDTVISINVIEHTQDVFKYLTGLYVSLKTGMYIFVYVSVYGNMMVYMCICIYEHTQDVYKYLTGLYVSLKTGTYM